MFKWLSNHKEWIFGGVGTAVVGTFLTAYLGGALSSGQAQPAMPPTDIPAPHSTATPTTPVSTVRAVPIEGEVLSIDLPEWVSDPVRGSITFNRDTEIARTGRVTAHLSVRNEDGTIWVESDPKTILDLRDGERLCRIAPAAHDVKYYLGFQAHCASSDACSYNIEGNRLHATIGDVEVILAPHEVQCP